MRRARSLPRRHGPNASASSVDQGESTVLGDVFICFHMFSYVFWFSGMKHDDVDSGFAVNLSIDECNELSCAASSMYVNTLEDVLSH